MGWMIGVVIIAVVVGAFIAKQIKSASPNTPGFEVSVNVSSASTRDLAQKLKSKKFPKINNHIFQPFNPDQLGNSLLDEAIRQHNHYIAFCHIGILDNGNQYAIMIGSSDEWLNVVTRTRAKTPTYERYGFSILEERWSYGSNVLGAPHFRDLIAQNMYEIISLIETQSKVHDEKRHIKKVEEAKAELEHKQYEEQEAARQEQLQKIIVQRTPIIQKHFSGLSFEFNKNKGNHARAQQNAKGEYYDVDLYAQTCNCKEFLSSKSKFELNDVRRLCSHLHDGIWGYDILKSKKDPLEDLVLKKIRRDVWGIHFFTGENDTRFAIIAYIDAPELDIAMPKTRDDGFTMSRWRYEDGVWSGSGGGKQLQQVVRTKLEELFCA